jgi:hypothetical protein
MTTSVHHGVPPLRIAARHEIVTFAELGTRIRHAVDASLKSLRGSGTHFGRCVCLYWDHEGETPLLMSPTGCEVDIGWEVETEYADPAAGIATTQTPAGTVATTTVIGGYELLPDAHRAVRRWCLENDLKRLGPNWEVYDHPRSGEPPRTDVYYLVR